MIVNLTQHSATQEQNCVELEKENKATLKELLTFQDIPSKKELENRANEIARLALDSFDEPPLYAMIGGAPFFMRYLEDALIEVGIQPLFAFSKREVQEFKKEDGSIEKTTVFKHLGFVGEV